MNGTGPLAQLEFPALCFNEKIVQLVSSAAVITLCTRAALKAGWYHGLIVVGSNGTAVRIKSARKLHGVGFLWGFNVFLNQRIRVEIEADGEPFTISFEELRRMIRGCIHSWHLWSARPDFPEFRARLLGATTIREILQTLSPVSEGC